MKTTIILILSAFLFLGCSPDDCECEYWENFRVEVDCYFQMKWGDRFIESTAMHQEMIRDLQNHICE